MSNFQNVNKKVKSINSDARLVVVTKTRSSAEVLDVIKDGAQIIGENRVQEAKEKFAELTSQNVEKHLIGHLQTNKSKDAVALFDVIESLDSPRLAEALNAAAGDAGKIQRVLIQVNISEDDAKSGVLPHELRDFHVSMKAFANLEVEGLMTITQMYDDSSLTKQDFLKMKSLFDEFAEYSQIESPVLSMGMSSDYELALESGANMIRVGTAIFGPRKM